MGDRSGKGLSVTAVTPARVALACLTAALLAGAPHARAGERVYTANMESGTITIVDADAMHVVATVDARGYQTHALLLSADRSRLFVINMHNGTLSVLDTHTTDVITTIGAGKLARAMALSPDGKELWVVNGAEDYLTVVDAASLKVAGRVPLGQIVGGGHLCFSRDGSRVYVTNPRSGTVSVLDARSRTVVGTIEVGKSPTFIRAGSDGRRVWGADTGSDEIYALDGSTNRLIGKLAVGRAPGDFAIVGEKLYVTVEGADEVAVVGDEANEVRVLGRIGVGGRARGIWPSRDGKRLYVVREGTNDLVVLDAASRKVIGTVPVGRRPVAVVAAR